MTASAVDVSVIVTSYMQLASLRLGLQALFAQDTDCSYEVVVCDDGSDRETTAGLVRVLESAPVPAYLVWQQDSGFRLAASRNNAIRMARGRLLIFLDGDLVPEANFVEVHRRAHEDELTLAVGLRFWRKPAVVGVGHEDIEALWALLRSDLAVDRRSLFIEAVSQLAQHWRLKSESWKACHGCNFSVPNSNLIEFDEGMVGWGFEDLDIAYRLNVLEGYSVTQINAIAYDVMGWVDRGQVWKQDDYIAHLRNGIRFLDKWAHTGLEPRHAVPSHVFEQETGLWRMAPFGRRRAEPERDVAFIRQWLTERGYLSRGNVTSPTD